MARGRCYFPKQWIGWKPGDPIPPKQKFTPAPAIPINRITDATHYERGPNRQPVVLSKFATGNARNPRWPYVFEGYKPPADEYSWQKNEAGFYTCCDWTIRGGESSQAKNWEYWRLIPPSWCDFRFDQVSRWWRAKQYHAQFQAVQLAKWLASRGTANA